MALTADEQAELDELKARRRATAGIQSTSFSDQSTTLDSEGLDKRIAALESKSHSGSWFRVAAFKKGV